MYIPRDLDNSKLRNLHIQNKWQYNVSVLTIDYPYRIIRPFVGQLFQKKQNYHHHYVIKFTMKPHAYLFFYEVSSHPINVSSLQVCSHLPKAHYAY